LPNFPDGYALVRKFGGNGLRFGLRFGKSLTARLTACLTAIAMGFAEKFDPTADLAPSVRRADASLQEVVVRQRRSRLADIAQHPAFPAKIAWIDLLLQQDMALAPHTDPLEHFLAQTTDGTSVDARHPGTYSLMTTGA
jgi:hypothetical protein